MLVDRPAFVNHLRRITCDGILPEAVVRDSFSSYGASVDRGFFVQAGSLPGCDPLVKEIGLPNLSLLLRALESFEDDKVAFDVVDSHVVLQTNERSYRLVMANPATISTRIDSETRDQCLKFLEGGTQHPLEQGFVKGMLKASQILKDKELLLRMVVGPTGSRFIVGDPKINAATFSLPEFRSTGETYTLVLPPAHTLGAFSQLSDFTRASMTLTGPDGVIGLREGDYLYIISSDKSVE